MHILLSRWRFCQWLALGAATAVLAGCAPTPESGADSGQTQTSARAALSTPKRPGSAVRSPSVSESLPDAYARSQYRDKGLGMRANKPADGDQSETPEDINKYELNPPRDSDQQGKASWYGEQFHGRKTASGERFDLNELTAAHKTLPFGTRVCVRSAVTGKSVVVRINDRGPFAPGRIIDLSKAAAQELGMLGLGIKPVELWQLDEDEEECPAQLNASAKKNKRSNAATAKASSAAKNKPRTVSRATNTSKAKAAAPKLLAGNTRRK